MQQWSLDQSSLEELARHAVQLNNLNGKFGIQTQRPVEKYFFHARMVLAPLACDRVWVAWPSPRWCFRHGRSRS